VLTRELATTFLRLAPIKGLLFLFLTLQPTLMTRAVDLTTVSLTTATVASKAADSAESASFSFSGQARFSRIGLTMQRYSATAWVHGEPHVSRDA
jgi:hypothetical protein